MSKVTNSISELIATLISGMIFSALVSVPLVFLWNWLMPDIFGLDKITYIQAWGLYVLSNSLFNKTNSQKSSDNN